jgi:DNA-binding CsgD family transcriptional regulator
MLHGAHTYARDERGDQVYGRGVSPTSAARGPRGGGGKRILSKELRVGWKDAVATSVIGNEGPADARTGNHQEQAGIAAFAAAAFLLDRCRRVMAGSARGEALIQAERVLRLDPLGRLRAARSADDAPLQAAFAMAEATHGPAQKPVRLLSTRSGRAWLVWIEACHVRAREDGCQRFPRIEAQHSAAAVLLFVTPADAAPSVRAEAIMAEFGLSAAESRLVSALLAGQTLDGYARETGHSRNTVRNQLAVVFEKTGTHRQSELVALIAGCSETVAQAGSGAVSKLPVGKKVAATSTFAPSQALTPAR